MDEQAQRAAVLHARAAIAKAKDAAKVKPEQDLTAPRTRQAPLGEFEEVRRDLAAVRVMLARVEALLASIESRVNEIESRVNEAQNESGPSEGEVGLPAGAAPQENTSPSSSA